jgi:arylsulfatase A-like enzyme
VNGNEDLNRYLNALHYSDEMFGKFMTDLKQRGLLESTLVVVVGDHGEAFGSHDQFGHGAELYEENVKVPLILINPEFEETKIPVVGGQVDIAPTIMDLLDLPRPKEWQGVSLFNLDMNNRAYFFNPHSYFLFGYREGNFKFIYNANWNETMVFDLSKDPEELNDLADKLPEMARQSTVRLGDWVHYHSAVINDKIGKLNARKRSKVVLSR